MVFGYAATYDLNDVPIAVYDQDGSAASRELIARFSGSPAFTVEAILDSGQRINALIDSRQVRMVLVIDRRFTRDLHTHQPAPMQLILDGRNSNTALLIQGYANTILNDFALSWAATHGGRPPPAVLDLRSRYNPTLSSRWFIVPGIVALLTQVVTLLVVGLSVAREREMGTFDQLLVTPLRQIDILLGKGLPGLLIGVIEASVIIAATVWWFRRAAAWRTHPAVSRTAAVCHCRHRHRARDLRAGRYPAAGAARCVSVHGAVHHAVGFRHADCQHASARVQVLTLINPMRYFLVIVRGVFLEGATLAQLASQFWPMAVIGFVTLAAAGWLFRKRVT